MVFTFDAELWLHTGEAAWHFVTLPGDAADEIAAATEGARRGFGSVRVEATIGSTTWTTSVFPDAESGSYLLPVKKAVRLKEDLRDGDLVGTTLEVLPI